MNLKKKSALLISRGMIGKYGEALHKCKLCVIFERLPNQEKSGRD